MSAQPAQFYTPEEYVEMERCADFKSEYISGQIFAMAGGSPEHSAISANILREAGNALRGKPGRTFGSDQRITIMPTGLKTYPDISIVCGELHLHPFDKNSLINPTVLFGVLSDSTETYDRGAKWAHYQRLESLQEYILVAQDKAGIEQYVRQDDGSWKYWSVHEIAGKITLPSLGCELALAEFYDKVTFEESALEVENGETL